MLLAAEKWDEFDISNLNMTPGEWLLNESGVVSLAHISVAHKRVSESGSWEM